MNQPRRARWPASLRTLALAVVVAMLYCTAMNTPVSHDEESYVVPSILAVNMRLYDDFMFMQPPDCPLLLSLPFRLIDDGYFRVARIIVWIFSAGSLLIFYSLATSLLRNRNAGLLATIAFASSQSMILAFGLARNDIMPCFLALLAVALVRKISDTHRFALLFYAIAGVFAAMAVETKLSYAFVPPVLAAYLLFGSAYQGDRHRIRKTIAFVLGGFVASIPTFYYFALNPRNFIYGVYTVNTYASRQWNAQIGKPVDTSFIGRSLDFIDHVQHDKVLFVSCCIVLLSIFAILWRSRARTALKSNLFEREDLIFWLAVTAIPLTVAPLPPHQQYFVPLVPFAILAACVCYRAILSTQFPRWRPVVVTLVVLACLPGLAKQVRYAGQPSAVGKVEQISATIQDAMAQSGLSGPVATLTPLRVVDSGLTALKEFAAGPFFFRTGDAEPESRIHELHSVAPKTLQEFLERTQPDAIVTGYEGEKFPQLEAGFIRFAEQNGYRRIDVDIGAGKLYLRQTSRQ